MKKSYLVEKMRTMDSAAKIHLHDHRGPVVTKVCVQFEEVVRVLLFTGTNGDEMTVGQFLSLLEFLPPEADIVDAENNPLLFVCQLAKGHDIVWLEAEQDLDLRNELSAQFEHAAEANLDETDFYSSLFNMGITVSHIEKYLGKESAEHVEVYCKENGLL